MGTTRRRNGLGIWREPGTGMGSQGAEGLSPAASADGARPGPIDCSEHVSQKASRRPNGDTVTHWSRGCESDSELVTVTSFFNQPE